MNIDERLERLTERHGALAESVESLTKDVAKTDRSVKRLGRYIRTVAQLVLDHEARLRSVEGDDEPETA